MSIAEMAAEKRNVLLVGQIYLDTILHVPKFPEEDSKLRATYLEQRTGGNTCNSAKVLSQFDQVNVCYMSAAGSRETSLAFSSHIIESLHNVNTYDTILYRDDTITPSSIIIHSEQSSSRTIISNNNIQDLNLDEFIYTFNKINGQQEQLWWWVHFEGRNISETIRQIDWLNEKAINGHWRQKLVISVELEKPEREDIELLIERGDVVFFSKLFAQYHQYKDAGSFLTKSPLLKKLKTTAVAFCTWGSLGASALINETKQLCQASPPKIEKVVDTVGAGDTFNAGIILYLSKFPSNINSALQFACNLATKKVGQQGFDNLKMPLNQ